MECSSLIEPFSKGNPKESASQHTSLARNVSFPLLLFYGLGTVLGAGIYVLIGKVAGSAGMLAPMAFFMAAMVAWVTALSYCQLSVLYPVSAGEAVYVEEGFHIRRLTLLTGLMIVLTGVVSAATLASGFMGYLGYFIEVNFELSLIVLLFTLMALALWGIAESLWVTACITLIELLGLLIVVAVCGDSLLQIPDHWQEMVVPLSMGQWLGVCSGAFLAFYAFIGFEDMVNIAEEVKSPEKNMPRAILWVVILATLLYFLLAAIAVLSYAPEVLSESKAPLAMLVGDRLPGGGQAVALISLIAVLNGILIQLIMASRVIYGLARRFTSRFLLQKLAYVHPVRKTPMVATVLIAVIITLFALYFPLATLAKITSFVILLIFTLVNLSLWRVQKRTGNEATVPGKTGAETPRPETQAGTAAPIKTFPLIGAFLCLSLLGLQVVSVFYL